MTAALAAAGKVPLRAEVVPQNLVGHMITLGLLGTQDDGALAPTAGDGKTPTGKTVEEAVAAFADSDAGKWLKAAPATGGPRLTPSAPGAAPATGPQSFDISTPAGQTDWFKASYNASPELRREIDAMARGRADA